MSIQKLAKYRAAVVRRAVLQVLGATVLLGAAAAMAADVQVTDARIRATGKNASKTVALFKITNAGTEAVILEKVDSPVAEAVAICRGRRRCDPAVSATLTIRAGKSLNLRPGLTWLRVTGLSRTLRVGEAIPLRLHFAGGDSMTVQAPVRRQIAANGHFDG